MKLWLIQRGKFKSIAKDDIEGIDSLIRLDYMGSSEFEWGALPASLHRMVDAAQNYAMHEVTDVISCSGESMFVYCDREKLAEVKEGAVQLAKNKYGYKEYCDMVDYVEGNNDGYEPGDFWWDIENDFIVVFGTDRAEKIQIAMDKLKEKWLPKAVGKKRFFDRIFRRMAG